MELRTILAPFVLTSFALAYPWPTMNQKLAQEKDLTQFFALLMSNKLAKSALMYRELTIFAPTNEAFDNFEGSLTEDLVLYHLVPMARTLENLEESYLDPILEEHPPLWINTDGKNHFVNNAMIIKNTSNFVVKSRTDQYGKSQVLHTIDEVLSPMAATTTSPTSHDFLARPQFWPLIPYTFNIFYKKIIQTRMHYHYKTERRNTFFVPADQFMDRATITRLSREVIETNIIPNRVVFARSAYEDFSYVTKSVDVDFYTTVEFLGEVIRVARVSKGTAKTISEKIIKILHANIPVKNGVVHVVKEVLGVFDKRLTKFPYLPVAYKLESDPYLNITNHLVEKSGIKKLLGAEDSNYTMFLPSDAAWVNLAATKKFNLSEFDAQLFEDRARVIMRRHFVLGEYYDLKRLIQVSDNLRGKEVILNVGKEEIMVRVYRRGGRFYMKWGSKEVEIVRPDYQCSNGVVHVIDAPLLFDSDLKGFTNADEYSSLLFKAWSTIKKIIF